MEYNLEFDIAIRHTNERDLEYLKRAGSRELAEKIEADNNWVLIHEQHRIDLESPHPYPFKRYQLSVAAFDGDKWRKFKIFLSDSFIGDRYKWHEIQRLIAELEQK